MFNNPFFYLMILFKNKILQNFITYLNKFKWEINSHDIPTFIIIPYQKREIINSFFYLLLYNCKRISFPK